MVYVSTKEVLKLIRTKENDNDLNVMDLAEEDGTLLAEGMAISHVCVLVFHSCFCVRRVGRSMG